jgi:hypothetical protein
MFHVELSLAPSGCSTWNTHSNPARLEPSLEDC